MKKFILYFILSTGLTYTSCERKIEYQAYPYEAEVLGINMDCGKHQIKFLNNLDKVVELCGKSVMENVYIAGNLPDSLKLKGLKIVLDIDRPSSNQMSACTTMGPSLNWVWITSAKPK